MLQKEIKSYIFVALFMNFLMFNFYAQGHKNTLNIIDSTEISFEHLSNIASSDNTVKLYNNCIYILKHYNDTLHKFNLESRAYSFVKLDIRKELKSHFYPDDFIICQDTIHLITANRTKIVRLNQSGVYLESIRIKEKKGYCVKSNASICYLPETHQYVIPVETSVDYKDFYFNTTRIIDYYQRDGLYGRYDTHGNLQTVFGKYESVFYDGKHQAIDDYEIESANDKLISIQSNSSKVEIYESQNTSKLVYDLPGRWIDQSFKLKPYNRNSNYEVYYNVIIESNYYYGIKKFGSDSIFGRFYRVALKDTTSSSIPLTTELVPKSACGVRSARELNQEALIASKKTFFQIFDLQGNLFYDGITPFHGTLLNNLNSNVILSYIWDKDRLIVYIYSLRVL